MATPQYLVTPKLFFLVLGISFVAFVVVAAFAELYPFKDEARRQKADTFAEALFISLLVLNGMLLLLLLTEG